MSRFGDDYFDNTISIKMRDKRIILMHIHILARQGFPPRGHATTSSTLEEIIRIYNDQVKYMELDSEWQKIVFKNFED